MSLLPPGFDEDHPTADEAQRINEWREKQGEGAVLDSVQVMVSLHDVIRDSSSAAGVYKMDFAIPSVRIEDVVEAVHLAVDSVVRPAVRNLIRG